LITGRFKVRLITFVLKAKVAFCFHYARNNFIKMNQSIFRCKCPIASALDIVGDKWSLVIIRDMLFAHKKTFTDFSNSTEKIASNILAARLKFLEEMKVLSKSKMEGNDKSYIYTLTNRGLNLLPVIAELTLWSDENLIELNPILVKGDYSQLKINRESFLDEIRQRYIKKFNLIE